MADTVSVRTLRDTPRQLVQLWSNISDGTGEAAVTKVDKSAFTTVAVGSNAAPAEPASLDIERIVAVVVGFAHVQILWDHTTDDQAIILPTGSNVWDFDDALDGAGAGLCADPRSAGGTGDVLVTTNGAAAGARYEIQIWFRKQVT